MIIDATFVENDMTIEAELGEVNNVSDDSFKRGYEEGEAAGYETGHGVGYETGLKEMESYWLYKGDHYVWPEYSTEIPDRAFYQHTNLATINVHDGVVSVGSEAFHSCSGLTAFPEMKNVTQIGQYAFYNCDLLGDVVLPPKLLGISSALFAGCANVKVRAIPPQVQTIGAYAFDNAQANNTASIPASVTSISNAAFRSNLGITTLTFFGTPTTISTSTSNPVFARCTNLTDIYVPWAEGEVAGAPWGAPNATVHYNYFKNISGAYTFPEGVLEVPANILQDNSTVTSVFLGDTVTAIRPYAFSGCKGLTSVALNEGLTIIEEYAFYGCSKLKITALPDTVDEIESGSMAGGVASLSKLPAAIRKLETYCFDGCPGNTFTEFPESLVVISAYALRNNTGLTTLTFKGTPEYGIAATALVGCTNLTDIYVPWPEGAVNGEFDANGARINWGAPNATVHHLT